jgi:hypothetical protein
VKFMRTFWIAAAAALTLQSAPVFAQLTPERDAALKCANAVLGNFNRAMEYFSLADSYFGLAWHEYRSTLDRLAWNAVIPGRDLHADDAATEAAQQRFIDRILRTARPETIQYYNFAKARMIEQAQACATGRLP